MLPTISTYTQSHTSAPKERLRTAQEETIEAKRAITYDKISTTALATIFGTIGVFFVGSGIYIRALPNFSILDQESYMTSRILIFLGTFVCLGSGLIFLHKQKQENAAQSFEENEGETELQNCISLQPDQQPSFISCVNPYFPYVHIQPLSQQNLH